MVRPAWLPGKNPASASRYKAAVRCSTFWGRDIRMPKRWRSWGTPCADLRGGHLWSAAQRRGVSLWWPPRRRSFQQRCPLLPIAGSATLPSEELLGVFRPSWVGPFCFRDSRKQRTHTTNYLYAKAVVSRPLITNYSAIKRGTKRFTRMSSCNTQAIKPHVVLSRDLELEWNV